MFNIFTRDGLISFLYVLPALLLSFAIHEFAHAYVAYKLGDRSQKALGRLTLHPFAHIDWMGFISIALLGFGWGKPVVVDDRNFKNKARDNMLVALAGPMSNLLLALLFTLIFKVLIVTGVISSVNTILINMFFNAILLNITFAIFNMLPIPPFDGSKVLFYFLPRNFKGIMYTLEKYSFYIVIILLVSGLGGAIISPIINFFLNIIYAIIF